MHGFHHSGPDAVRSELRASVAAIERELTHLQDPPSALLSYWADMVKQLALGPEPEVRECPVCKHIGMRAATLCGYCWTKLTPPTGPDGAAP